MPINAHNKQLDVKVSRGILKPLCMELLTANYKRTTATTAAAHPYCTAVATAEQSAAFVSFQRQQPSLPPTQNVNSAAFTIFPAKQFGGSIANSAAFAA